MKTALYDRHTALGAKMVDFAGWEMPVQYKGIIDEHNAVRNHVGIFDVSHMGRIDVEGPDAERFMDYICTNKIAGKKDGLAIYTVICRDNGGAVDDALIYRIDAEHFFLVANASNRDKDRQHIIDQVAAFDVTISDRYEEEGILAIQGPQAVSLVQKRFPEAEELKPMRFTSIIDEEKTLIIARTGYTGSGGYEVYAPNELLPSLWDWFMENGAQPIGLGARDTLRLEMGFALYGHELSDTIAPTESIAAWTVKWDKEFIGKEALQQLEERTDKRSQYGIILHDKGIAREGYEVLKNGDKIGVVTSGTQSPSLNKAIGIILVEPKLSVGDIVEVQIRKNQARAEVVKFPFVNIEK